MTSAVVNAEPVSEGNLAPVSSELRYAGHTLKRVFREKRIAIYARARPNSQPHELELGVIRDKPAATLPSGSIVPEREAYPQPSEWGRWAWSFPIREREFVFDLAARMAARDAPYGAWVREQLTLHAQQKTTRRKNGASCQCPNTLPKEVSSFSRGVWRLE
jgi:hypothetical protein